MQYIYNEIPSWAIDWVNKVFTTINAISKIEEVFIWWVAYRDLIFSLNTITLNDAPPVGASISVDYFIGDLETPIEEWNTLLWDIINDVYEKIWQARIKNWQPNRTYPESQVKKFIINWYDRIKNLRTYKDKISTYSFNKAKDWVAIWYSANWVTIWDVDYIPANWIATFDNWITFEYTSYTAEKLNWAVWAVYQNWEKIRVWYRIPTWVKKISEILVNWHTIDYKDFREYSNWGWIYYTIVHASNNRYIILPFTSFDAVITVKYISSSSLIEDDNDLVDIDNEYYELLSYYAIYKLFLIREDDRAKNMFEEYSRLLKEYKSYKSRAVDWINNKLRSNILTNF